MGTIVDKQSAKMSSTHMCVPVDSEKRGPSRQNCDYGRAYAHMAAVLGARWL